MPSITHEENRPKRLTLKFRQLPKACALVRLAADAAVPPWATRGDFTSSTRTADELCIVCPAENLPAGVSSQTRWVCLKLEGPYPVSATGIIVSFVEPLSDHGIPIFVISTYDTDYVLIQEEIAALALELLRSAGHQLLPW